MLWWIFSMACHDEQRKTWMGRIKLNQTMMIDCVRASRNMQDEKPQKSLALVLLPQCFLAV